MGNENKNKQLGKWSCNYCGEVAGVQSGICPSCGPTQTTPIDDKAKGIAGVEDVEEGTIV